MWRHPTSGRRILMAPPRRETFAKSIESMTSQKTRPVEGVDVGWTESRLCEKMSDYRDLSST